MRPRTSHYLDKSVVTMLAAAAGLVMGFQIESTHSMSRSSADECFVAQARASDAFVLSATPSASIECIYV